MLSLVAYYANVFHLVTDDAAFVVAPEATMESVEDQRPPRIRIRGGRKKRERYERWAASNPELAAAQEAARREAFGLAPPSADSEVSEQSAEEVTTTSTPAIDAETVASRPPSDTLDTPVAGSSTLSEDSQPVVDGPPPLKRPRGGRLVRIRVQRAIDRAAARAAAESA